MYSYVIYSSELPFEADTIIIPFLQIRTESTEKSNNPPKAIALSAQGPCPWTDSVPLNWLQEVSRQCA